jgi:hypothetical protein
MACIELQMAHLPSPVFSDTKDLLAILSICVCCVFCRRIVEAKKAAAAANKAAATAAAVAAADAAAASGSPFLVSKVSYHVAAAVGMLC